MTKRHRTPSDIETNVLTSSGRRCCICFGLNDDFLVKKGQIAHLDRNPSNYNIDNLAWLCFEHHDEYDSRTSQSKGLTLLEVKVYRNSLYNSVIDRRSQTIKGSEDATYTDILSPFNDKYNKNLIIDVSKVFDYSIEHLEKYIGKPKDVFWRKIGTISEVPDGGQTREYESGPYIFWIHYDKSETARGIRIFEGIEELNTSLEEWYNFLPRVNLSIVVNLPDITGLTTKTWFNQLGYKITIASSKVGGNITAIRVFKL